ncbi:LuxR family transcriptional regulator [Chloroflexales bacterium ZM16-3]|nr:LuxR family transcriptional regulator [Chloroflexales bacterium ZM16-3]
MPTSILATKLFIPPPRPSAVPRPRLLTHLSAGLHGKLTLISAPAGFGKTTLLSAWVAGCGRPVAWLSLDTADADPSRFLVYLIAALQTVAPALGDGLLAALQSSQPPQPDAAAAALVNMIAAMPHDSVLVLDDYHAIAAQPVDRTLRFLLEHLPPALHLVIATRQDPPLPLARLRARGQLTELRAADLRFTPAEAAGFLNQSMGLDLSAEAISALERRTEGWIAGLQLAALSMRGSSDTGGFIRSFTGSHRFVMDYLVEEVLHQLPEHVQAFLLRTAILGRLCGPLCDAVARVPAAPGQETLAWLERANLFLVPLDDERRWYRYHHLFADLLRQQLRQRAAAPQGGAEADEAELHARASAWYEDTGLELEAFRHAAAANDVARAARLIAGGGMPLHFRGAVAPVLGWLASLPQRTLDAHPALWVTYASALSMTGQVDSVEAKLQAAEAALPDPEADDTARNLVGHIAALRAFLAATQNQVEPIIAQSRRALEYLHPDNLAVRTATIWKLGIAYRLQGDRAAAARSFREAAALSQESGNTLIAIWASIGLGQVQELDLQLHLAGETYRRVLDLGGDLPGPAASDAHLGLARISYHWGDLDAAERHGCQGRDLARQMESIDTSLPAMLLLARVHLARGDVGGAAARLAEAEQFMRRNDFLSWAPEIAEARVLTLLRQGDHAAAAALAQTYDLPQSQARVLLAQGDPAAALATLEPWRDHVEARGWADERLRAMVLQALALHAHGDGAGALGLLGEALALAEPDGCVRLFVDEGPPMTLLLRRLKDGGGMMGEHLHRLLRAFGAQHDAPASPAAHPLIEPLSEREREILGLIVAGLANQQIADQLTISLNTVLYHTKNIYGKLGVNRRPLAIARARELNLM